MRSKSVRKKKRIVAAQAQALQGDFGESCDLAKMCVVVEKKQGRVEPCRSAILVIETKKERMRTIREYEKQRDSIRSIIAR